MKIAEALRILELDTLPKSEKEVSVAYKRLAKKCHPDSGGSEEAFQELGAAVDYVLRALALVDIAVEKNKKRSKESDALAGIVEFNYRTALNQLADHHCQM